MAHVLVTGGSGRIGSSLVEGLLEHGHRVTVMDRRPPTSGGVEFIETDLSSVEPASFDYVFHLAARIDYRASLDEMYKANVLPTQELLDKIDTKKFIFMSSTSVYGESRSPLTEESECRPYSLYGQSKLEAERRIIASNRPYVIIRSSQVFGPQFKEGYLSFLRAVKSGKARILGRGDNYIPLVHIDDLVRALLHLGLSKQEGVFNVDGGYMQTQEGFFKLAAELLGVPAPPHMNLGVARLMSLLTGKAAFFGEYTDKLTRNRLVSITKLQESGFFPSVGLRPAMSEVIERFTLEGLL